MRAIGYTRVSTEEQAESGLSLEGQAQRIAAFCCAKEWELVELVEDAGFSGGTTKRPGLEDILERVRRGELDVVVVLKLDRLTRSVKDLGLLLELFEKAGVAFCSVTDSFDTTTANGKLVLNILGSVAQWERDIIAERTRDALAVKRHQGRRAGELPFGFSLGDDGDKLIPNPERLAVVGRIAAERIAGESLLGIARRLNAAGVATAKGARWAAETVKRIMRNDIYESHVAGFVAEGRKPA